jgi:hypothetical protein
VYSIFPPDSIVAATRSTSHSSTSSKRVILIKSAHTDFTHCTPRPYCGISTGSFPHPRWKLMQRSGSNNFICRLSLKRHSATALQARSRKASSRLPFFCSRLCTDSEIRIELRCNQYSRVSRRNAQPNADLSKQLVCFGRRRRPSLFEAKIHFAVIKQPSVKYIERHSTAWTTSKTASNTTYDNGGNNAEKKNKNNNQKSNNNCSLRGHIVCGVIQQGLSSMNGINERTTTRSTNTRRPDNTMGCCCCSST